MVAESTLELQECRRASRPDRSLRGSDHSGSARVAATARADAAPLRRQGTIFCSMAAKHINARPGDFATTVLMPGDPLRARHIADRYLGEARQVNDVRNMWGY